VTKVPSIAQSRPSARLPAAKPRQPHEETRQLDAPAPADPLHDDSSGLLTPDGQKLTWDEADGSDTPDVDLDSLDSLENIGERTLITAVPGMSSFMVDVGGDGDQVEATLVTTVPSGFGGRDDAPAGPRNGERGAAGTADDDDDDDDDGPTLSRDVAALPPIKPAGPKPKAAPPPAALAAKIHAPAVSELRKPRPSRRTPPGGSPVTGPNNVLHAIVASKASEPMPAPRPTPPSAPQSALHATVAMPPQNAMPPGMSAAAPMPMMSPQGMHTQADPYGAQFPTGTPGGQPSYSNDASGLPMGIPTPPGVSVQPAHGMPYLPAGGHPGYGAQPLATQMSPHGYPQMTPGALYQFQPSQQPASLTGQMRAWEVDEIPSQYKIGAARQRWFTYIVSGILAVSVAAGVTFLIIRSTRDSTPSTGSVHLESVPSGAEVLFDGTRLTDRTPLTIDGAPVGTRHTIRIELTGYEGIDETVDIPKTGREVSVLKTLRPVTGKIIVESAPEGAEIRINGELRGRTPMTITGVDMTSAKVLELRLKDYQPFRKELAWKDGRIDINAALQR
jgi:hypothetical protein